MLSHNFFVLANLLYSQGIFLPRKKKHECNQNKNETPFLRSAMLVLGDTKTGVVIILVIFEERPVLHERMCILKNDPSTYHPRFSFTPKTGIAFPTDTLFLL